MLAPVLNPLLARIYQERTVQTETGDDRAFRLECVERRGVLEIRLGNARHIFSIVKSDTVSL